MGLREQLRELFHPSPKPPGGRWEVTDIQYSTAPDGKTVVTFPNAKRDFSDGAYGVDGRDLSNAFVKGAVVMGDVLEITTAYRPADKEGKGTRLMYLEPDSALFGGMEGDHKFLPEKPYAQMPNCLIEGMITSWTKVGHIMAQQWNAMMEEVFGKEALP